MGKFRKPNWEKWKLIPQARIWEVVALSLNIDPDFIEHDRHDWMADKEISKESSEFKIRCEVVLANIRASSGLIPTAISMGVPLDTELCVTHFATFAEKTGWSIHGEFPREVSIMFEPTKWLSKDSWSEGELRDLLCGKEPNMSRAAEDATNQTLEEIRRAVTAGTLNAITPPDMNKGDVFYAHHRFYRPSEAIRWAVAKPDRFPKFPFSFADSQAHITSVTDYLCRKILFDIRNVVRQKASSNALCAGDFAQLALLIQERIDANPAANNEIEALANRQNITTLDPSKLERRAETTYLNIIGALLDVISQGIPDASKNGKTIGPVAGWTSEAKLIQAIDGYYTGFDGLSQSNLQRKFPAAKKSLEKV
jgi:hypothetical protein